MSLEHLEKLKSISKNLDKESYLEIYDNIRKLGIDSVIKFEIPPENIFVIRALERRRKTYNHISQISYNPNPKGYNRANRPGLKIFYGSLQVPGKENPVISNIDELIEIAQKEINSNEINVIELIVGAWKLKKKIPSIPIIYNPETLSKIDIFKPLYDNYKQTERTHNVEILKFISGEFAKETFRNPYAYQISAAFSEFWFINSLKNENVILYPSVRSNQGVNIAIHADRVYEYLEPTHIWTTDVYFNKNAIVTDLLDSTNEIDNKGNFKLLKSNDPESNQGYEKTVRKLNQLVAESMNS